MIYSVIFPRIPKIDSTVQFINVIILLGVLIFGVFFFIDKEFWRFADEVYDEGYSVKIIRFGQEINMPLKDIKKIVYTPQRYKETAKVTLTFNYDTPLGTTVEFIPIVRSYSSTKHDAIDDLMKRIESQSRYSRSL